MSGRMGITQRKADAGSADCSKRCLSQSRIRKSRSLPAPMPNTVARRNRCFEYDAVGDSYVRF